MSESFQPCRTQLMGDSSIVCRGRWCWQSHQDPPRQSSWWRSRHAWQIMLPFSPIAARRNRTVFGRI
jgi:hypothetical protein